jgi:hypothetical protein
MPNDERQLVELDTRRRLTLRVGHHDRYLAHELEDGTIILEPAFVLTRDEMILTQHPEIAESIDRDLKNRDSWTRGPRRQPRD